MQIGEQFEVSIRGWFAAAHQLRLLDGSVEPLHGHNWQVCVTFAGERLDGMSVLVDFVAARRELDALLATLHDRNLNDLPPFAGKNPSAEIVAVHVAQELSRRTAGILAATGVRLACVEIEEAPGCVARFRAEVRPPARP